MVKPEEAAAAALGNLAPGSVIANRYRLETLLGQGGMGAVYRVEHVHMGKRFAFKVLLPEWARTAEALARFKREAIAAGKVTHPHIAQAIDFGQLDDGSCFLVLEYLEGITLRRALKKGPLLPSRALHIADGVASALEAAHAAGIVHRDLKPENIMLVTQDGDRDYVKVLDFGIAKVEGSHDSATKALTRRGALMGTPQYMAPEQVLGEKIDSRADLYALGAILFEMLKGTSPFVGDAATVLRQQLVQEAPPLPTRVAHAVGPRVVEAVRRLLAKTPEARFRDAAEVRAELVVSWAPAAKTEEPARALPTVEMEAPSASSLQSLATSVRGAMESISSTSTDASRAVLGWTGVVREYLRAPQMRRRLRGALAWPSGLLNRLRPSRKRSRSRTTRTRSLGARLRAWARKRAPWLTLRRARIAALAAAILGIAGALWSVARPANWKGLAPPSTASPPPRASPRSFASGSHAVMRPRPTR